MNDFDVAVIRHGMVIPVQFLIFEWLWWFVPLAGAVLALAWCGLRFAKRRLRIG